MLETRKGLRPSLLHIYHDVFEKDVPVLLKMPLAFDNPQGLRRMALWVRGGIAKISTMADNNPSLKGLGTGGWVGKGKRVWPLRHCCSFIGLFTRFLGL